MSLPFQPGYAAYTQGFGTAPAGVSFPIYVTAAPTSSFIQGPLGIFQPGQRAVWINTAVYELLGFTSAAGILSANWVEIASSSGDILAVLGTANQITATTVGGTATLSLPAAITAPGSLTTTTSLAAGTTIAAGTTVTAGTGIAATTGNITATNGNLVFGTAGNKISAPAATTTAAGANSFGRVALTAGAAVVSTTAITATSIVLLTNQVLGTVAAPFALAVTARTAGTSFTITSADGTDTSTIGWVIIN